MATVDFQQASRIYDETRPPAVNRINLSIADGEFLVLVGPSGCGKSTTLRMLAGLEPVDEGSIFIDGVDVSETPARNRDTAMVFQSYALYPNEFRWGFGEYALGRRDHSIRANRFPNCLAHADHTVRK